MKNLFEKFVGATKLGDVVLRLDRCFDTIRKFDNIGPYGVTSNFTFKNNDAVDSVQVDATVGNLIVYLPDQPNGNRRRRITKIDVSGNTVTVNGSGNLISGSATYVLATQYNSVTVEPTGMDWLVIAFYP